ncbi:MAG TPA: hypothetical protein PLX97_08675 [Gemmatales bacterium]|nr:hypothetical protein [Gemmatales bacterium]
MRLFLCVVFLVFAVAGCSDDLRYASPTATGVKPGGSVTKNGNNHPVAEDTLPKPQ